VDDFGVRWRFEILGICVGISISNLDLIVQSHDILYRPLSTLRLARYLNSTQPGVAALPKATVGAL
jgi:hypothetical protein